MNVLFSLKYIEHYFATRDPLSLSRLRSYLGAAPKLDFVKTRVKQFFDYFSLELHFVDL